MNSNTDSNRINILFPHPIILFLILGSIGIYFFIYSSFDLNTVQTYLTLASLAILISISLLVLSNPVWGLATLTFLLPLTNVWPDFFRTLFINVPLVTSFVVIIGFLTIGATLLHLAENKIGKIGWSSEVTIALLFVLWIIFSHFDLSTTASDQRIWAWTYLQLFCLMVLGATIVTDNLKFLLVRYSLVAGTVFSAIGGVVFGGFRISETATFGLRLAGLHDNPTEFAILCVLSLVCLNFAIPNIKTRKFRTINILLTLPLLFGLVFSISRTGLASAIAVLVLLLAIKFRINLGVLFVKTVPIAIFTLGLILTIALMPNSYRDLWFGSMRKEILEQTGTTRTRIEVWSISIDLFKENAITGVGIGNFSNLAQERWSLSKRYEGAVVHNSYLSILSQTGSIGFMLFLVWNTILILRLIKTNAASGNDQTLSSGTYTLLFFLFVWGIFGMFTSVEYGKFYWLMSGICIGISTNIQTDNQKVENAPAKTTASTPATQTP